jgi:8-oxo-dGTP pyrophosphatase MutT (NUDIX family)
MIKHKKLGKWLPPGGHIDANEIPDVAAIREVKEETGLDVELYAEKFPGEQGLSRPYGIQRNIIEEGIHEHLDLIYLAFENQGLSLRQNIGETDGINWFNIEEIEADDFETFEATRQWCIYFFALINKLDENNK